MGVKGKIHSIETFGTVDGPGIRYVVFLQGCPLRCKFCHNPDTWETGKGKELDSEVLAGEVQQYLSFYASSGGGITASGGEPTLQPLFVEDVFKRVKALGLNTALDTSGYVEIDRIQELLKVTDLVLLDIKEADEPSHQELTGVKNQKIIDFAEGLSEMNIPVWIRHVIIPGLTDGEQQIKALGELLMGLKNIQRVELLGFHKMGTHKWIHKGCADPLEQVPAASHDSVEKARKILRNMGLIHVL